MTSELPANLRAYLTVIYEALAELSDTNSAIRDSSPLDAITVLANSGRAPAAEHAPSRQVLDALIQIGSQHALPEAIETANELFETPRNFREAIYFVSWLTRSSDQAIALSRARHYVELAAAPDRNADLLVDREAVLRSTNFSTLWHETRLVDSALASLGTWQANFTATYTRAHGIYHRELAAVVDAIDDLNPRATAVERLNGLRRLGPPVASTALDQFHELERLYACPISPEALLQSLREAPACPECRFALGSQPPSADARRVRQAIERGLIAQQRRLAQRVVSRLLEQPSRSEGERLARFVQVVQASDLAGLAIVLDDTIIEFLRDFLEPQPVEIALIDRLATSFPEVTLANLDAAVAELRRLLTSDVVANGGLLRLGDARQDTCRTS